jgi:hypothetical protein
MKGRFARVPPQAAAAHKLGAPALRVLIAISAYADANGRAYPSLKRIARETGISRRNLPRAIRALVSAGLMRSENRRDEAGDAASNYYYLVYPANVSSRGMTPVAVHDDTVVSLAMTRGVIPGEDRTAQNRSDHLTERGEARPRGGASGIETYEPGADIVRWAAEHVSTINPLDRTIIDSFRDHHRAKGRPIADLDAAYRTWLRREPEFRKNRPQSPNGLIATAVDAAIMEWDR